MNMEKEIKPVARTVREMPECLRPREAVERMGVRQVQDDVLLAILLRSGVRGQNVVELARHLLTTHGSLTALAAASPAELSRSVKGLGKVKSQVLAAALELGRRLAAERVEQGLRVRSPADVAVVMRPLVTGLDQEAFWVLHLDAKGCLKGPPVRVTTGLLDASLVHPREVFREAIRQAIASVVLAHNHPSGDPAPSGEDLRVTRQLVAAGRVLDIRVTDHVILGKPMAGRTDDFLSMREAGVVAFEA